MPGIGVPKITVVKNLLDRDIVYFKHIDQATHMVAIRVTHNHHVDIIDALFS